MIDYHSASQNRARSIMARQILQSLGRTAPSQFLIKGSATNCILPKQSITRHPRDLDLTTLKPIHPHEVSQFLEQAAAPHHIHVRPLAKSELPLGKYIERLFQNVEKYIATNAEGVELEIGVLLNEATQDVPVHMFEAIGMSDPRLALLHKLSSINTPTRPLLFRTTDMIDIYNLYHSMNNGAGLSKDDLDVINNIILYGANYRKWQRLLKLYQIRKCSIAVSQLFSKYRQVTLAPPTMPNIEQFQLQLQDLCKDNIIEETINLEKAAEIYKLNYTLSQKIFAQQGSHD